MSIFREETVYFSAMFSSEESLYGRIYTEVHVCKYTLLNTYWDSAFVSSCSPFTPRIPKAIILTNTIPFFVS